MEYATGRLGSARVSRASASAARTFGVAPKQPSFDFCDEMKRAGAVLLKSGEL